MGLILLFLISVSGCELNPLKKLTNPGGNDEVLNNSSWVGDWVIYDDDIRTQGGIVFTTGYDHQSVDFRVENKDCPEGNMCFKYAWDGGKTYNYSDQVWQHYYCQLNLI